MAFFARSHGISAKNLSVHVIVAACLGNVSGQEALDKGIRVKTSSFSRPSRQHHHVQGPKANGNYINSILAHKEARQTATTKHCCWTSTASLLKVRAKTFHDPQRQALHT